MVNSLLELMFPSYSYLTTVVIAADKTKRLLAKEDDSIHIFQTAFTI